MNKLLTKIVGVALGASLAVGVGVAVANSKGAEPAHADTGLTQTISYTNFSGGTQSSGSSITSTNTGVISVNLAKGYKNSTYTHDYANGGCITVTGDSSVTKISSVVITATGTSYTGAQSGGAYTVTTGGGTVSISGSTITYSGGTAASAVLSHNKQLRFTEMVVTYDTSSGSSKTVTGISVSGSMTKTSYTTAESWDPTGLTVTAIYDNDPTDTEELTSGFNWTYQPESPTTSTQSVVATAHYSSLSASSSAQAVTVTAAPGSAEQPYTVAQARAAIDAGSGITGVYATGIVSEIVTAYNSQYGNISFNIIDDGGSDVLEAYRCSGTEAANVIVGDTVVVSGNLTKYNSTYEFAQGCTLVSLVHPVGANTISFDSDGGTDPDDITRNDGETFTFPGAGTKNGVVFKGWSDDGGKTVYAEGSTSPEVDGPAEYVAIWQTEGSSSDPYTVAEARAAITTGYGVKNAYATGIVSAIVTAYSSNKITFNFSDDGDANSDQLEAYHCVSGEADASQVAVGDTVLVHGNLTLYNNTTYEFGADCTLESLSHPAVPTYTVTYTAGTNGSGTYLHEDQPEGSYTLLAFANLTGISADSGYRFKSYTVDGVERDPGYQITLSAAKSITVNFEESNGETSVSTAVGTYATAHSWTNQSQYLTMNIDSIVTATVAGGGNSGKYYSGDSSWRLYSSENATLTISVSSGYTLVSVTLTFLSTDAPTVTYGGNDVSSESAISLSGTSGVFSVTAGKLHLTEISVTYTAGSVTTYTITYNANNGSAQTMEPTTGAAPQVAACTFTYDGYSFARWNTQADGEGTDYAVGATVSANITLYAIWEAEAVNPSEYFTKITSTSDVSDGKYLIVYEDGNLCFDGSLETLDVASNTKPITLANLLNSYFTIDDGKILSASGLYIGQTTDANGMKAQETELTNTISFDEDGNLVVLSSGGAYLRYNATSGQERFRYFKSSTYTGQKAIQLYKVDFAKVMLGEITCNSQGTSQPTGSWSNLESYYNTLSTSEKGLFLASSASESGTDMQKAMARYDYIVGKYLKGQGLTAYKDFIGRDPSAIASSLRVAFFEIADDANGITSIVIAVSLLSLTAYGAYFFLRKKKEQ